MAAIGGFPGGNYSRERGREQMATRTKEPQMELRAAVQLARQDWDEGMPDEAAKTDYESALSIRGSLFMPRTEDEKQWTWAWQDHGTPQSVAYRRVLEAAKEEIEALVEPVIVWYHNDEFEAEIKRVDESFMLWWGDYVANEWTETYDDLAVAVARLAVLIDAVAHDAFMNDEPAEFAASARTWLDHNA